MKTVLITGGSGAVGAAFIKTFYDQYQFISYGRNEKQQAKLQSDFSKVKILIGSIENKNELIEAFIHTKPDIVIHAAALKYIHIAEQKPSQAIESNLLGSLNVVEASRIAQVSVTIGISSDKALSPSVYGYTKQLMERLFFEADSESNRFIICRLSNVAGSAGSVIPLWLELAKKNEALKITDPQMNRFMLTPTAVATLIQKAIEACENEKKSFVLTKKIKAVNLFEIAQCISSNIEIIGKRPGETLDETLVSDKELPFTYCDDEYIYIRSHENAMTNTCLTKSLNSLIAEKLTREEIKNLIQQACHENIN